MPEKCTYICWLLLTVFGIVLAAVFCVTCVGRDKRQFSFDLNAHAHGLLLAAFSLCRFTCQTPNILHAHALALLLFFSFLFPFRQKYCFWDNSRCKYAIRRTLYSTKNNICVVCVFFIGNDTQSNAKEIYRRIYACILYIRYDKMTNYLFREFQINGEMTRIDVKNVHK